MPGRRLDQFASRLFRENGTDILAAETDRGLLQRFLREQDEAAFEILVRRHDRLVRSAISKVLTNPHDCEDAFQATFLILVRRAKSFNWRAGLGPWLYGVAHRVAVKARNTGRMRKVKEAGSEPAVAEQPPDLSWREACALLHAELDSLPDRYRLPLLLCYLEGKSRDEAASALKVSPGTVKGRLERGRVLLRNRLKRRGVTLSAGLLAAVAVENSLAFSQASVESLLKTVRGSASPRVLALTQEGIMSTILSKFTRSTIAILGLAVISSAIIAASGMPAADDKVKIPSPPVNPKTDDRLPKQPLAPAAPVMVTVKGHLIGPDKAPEPGATVAVWANDKKLGETITTKDQMFQVTVPGPLPAGAKVVVTKPGFAPDWANVPVNPEKTPVELSAVPDDAKIIGRVTDLEGQPVANLPVVIDRIGRPRPGKTIDEHIKMNSASFTANFNLDSISTELIGIPSRVVTDKDGQIKITGVGKDRAVRMTTRSETTEHLQVRVVTREIDANLEQKVSSGVYGATFTLRLGPSRPIVGTVRDAKTGDPVSGMKVTDVAHLYLRETTTDKDGKFRLIGVGKQPLYHLNASSLGEAPYFDTTVKLDDPQGLGEIALDIKVHRGIVVTGRVADTAGKPVAGQVHHLWSDDNPYLKDNPGIGTSTILLSHWGDLDRDGRYKLLVFPGPGAITVGANPEDAFPQLGMLQNELRAINIRRIPIRAHALLAVNIDPNNPKTLTCDFTLAAGKTREIVIRGVDGKLPDKLLAVWQTEGSRHPVAAKSIAGSMVTLTGLSPKNAKVVVLIDEAKTVGAVATATGDAETPVTVTLEKLGSITGRVLDADGNPAANAEVRLWLILDRVRFKLTEQASAALKKENVPETVLSKLDTLNDKVFVIQQELLRELRKVLSADEVAKYRSLILNRAISKVTYDNLPLEIFVFPGARYLASGAWNDFTGRTTKTDKDGRFTLSGLIPGQQYRLLTGFNLEKIDGELLQDRTDFFIKPGENTDLGDLKPKK